MAQIMFLKMARIQTSKQLPEHPNLSFLPL